MLIKEYRIPLPLTVDEYRIAQLYMIAKKSRDESKGTGSGVEILVNEPYEGGPGGTGQYTHKVYHVGSHLPGWFKSLLPKSALTVEEEAWNAYPYTKTRYTCPFVEKFSLEIETRYFPDNGYQENVFQLQGSDLRNRIVDVIDVVRDQLSEYVPQEDPKQYVSQKTGRGPLTDNWLDEYWDECKSKTMPTPSGKALMCAYKLCRVEFRYWGMQTKLEKFIHDVALRKTMLRAHIQAWVWQDEWVGLTMDDIRRIEQETQELLKKTMAQDGQGALSDSPSQETNLAAAASGGPQSSGAATPSEPSSSAQKTLAATLGSIEKNDQDQILTPVSVKKKTERPPDIQTGACSSDESDSPTKPRQEDNDSRRKVWIGTDVASAASWRMKSIVRDSDSESDDEYFDCQGSHSISEDAEVEAMAKWSSMELLNEENIEGPNTSNARDKNDSIFSHTYLQRVVSERTKAGGRGRMLPYAGRSSIEVDASSCPGSPTMSLLTGQQPSCPTSVLLLVLHAGSVLDANTELSAKKSDITTFRGSFECVMRQHYPSMVGHVAIKLVSCPSVCTEGLGILSSLNPYSFDVSPSCLDAPQVTHDSIPIGSIPLLATANVTEYQDAVSRAVTSANNVYHEFLKSEEGLGFNGQICIIGDSMGSVLAYDALCRSGRHDLDNDLDDHDRGRCDVGDETYLSASRLLSAPSGNRRRSSSTSDHSQQVKLDFEVSELFMFGSPLALVLAYRKISVIDEKNAPIHRPGCQQVYNLFHPTDPVAARIEPLLSARFSMLPPINIPRYQKYPLGNGQPYHLLTQKWWGNKRLDYALYCPDGLSNFPTNALPHLFHASYWESSDVIAFILRQLGRFELLQALGHDDKDLVAFSPNQPREKWIRKRTSVKLKNVSPNHRANDVIVKEGKPQVLLARFMYGPLDMITLHGEKIDIHIMKDAPAGEWQLLSTEVTDKNGRVSYTIPSDKSLGYGIYPIKMVVRGDHTSADFYMAVVPPKTECIVFSIDGSFTASMSVTGRDPKVRAGAVDVVRHWQELGYLIIYVTGRPDMQQQKVVSWLSQHNFPHGLVSFADGLSTDPLRHKTTYLQALQEAHDVLIHSAYGSSKDIAVYRSLDPIPRQIYIIGKVSKKHQSQATILSEGYAAHLAQLVAPGGSRPAQGNARMVIPRGYFGLPGHNVSLRRRRNAAKRTKSFPVMGHSQDLSGVPSRGIRGSSAPHSATGVAPSSIPPQTPPASAGVSEKL
ncbi:protein retinal degeneration B isoform X2 [Thrips palmi]|uniref:Protein retinal degeneration B isoform X2 n=1 Tax=Thrips palmi TaxID=161013 RepID=A0A6P8Z016_THRPL|nr:protein retinal degeneration B isoform X2 [Thrips palmi]